MLRFAPWLMIGLLVGPVVTGLTFIIGPAFGFSLLLSEQSFTIDHFRAVLAEPGIGTSIWLGYWLGPATALISLGIVVLFTAAYSGTRAFGAALTALKPVIAMPHAAAAFGLAFLIAPSGFLMRLVSPELTGFIRPPDWLILNDPGGFALLAGLVVKEVPFLFLVLVAALPQTDPRRHQVARVMGYGRIWAWLTAIFPGVYRQIRLPVFAVIAFAGAVVDVALILGPNTPPLLSVRILRWMSDPDLGMRSVAAAAALIQLLLTLAALGTWWVGERIVAHLGRRIALGGHRFGSDAPLRAFAALSIWIVAFMMLAGIGLMAVWSFSGVWRFPATWPQSLTAVTWIREAAMLGSVVGRTFTIGASAALIAVILTIACLENEYRREIALSPFARLILYLPLLVPQIAFLVGLSVWLLWNGLDGSILAVTTAHLVFILPYTYLILSEPWNAFDTRYLAVARLLGKSDTMALFTIRLPILLRPILTAFALGFAISVAQYLPTLLAGAGRQPTVTTEAVALASGGNRRLIGSYALMQTLLPLLIFALTAAIPTFLWRNRRQLKAGFGQ